MSREIKFRAWDKKAQIEAKMRVDLNTRERINQIKNELEKLFEDRLNDIY
ncbi:hypothetical protein FAM21838_02008 [Lentilactobacillus parabuchneri]|nr:hypothetical protein [Lentilactobacillus parabuchneri]ORN08325.1 hypothetical protein FAM21838_02008 [Lentilactobacillus parabuchneri]